MSNGSVDARGHICSAVASVQATADSVATIMSLATEAERTPCNPPLITQTRPKGGNGCGAAAAARRAGEAAAMEGGSEGDGLQRQQSSSAYPPPPGEDETATDAMGDDFDEESGCDGPGDALAGGSDTDLETGNDTDDAAMSHLA